MARIRSWFLLILYGLFISELLLAKKRDCYDVLEVHKDASDRQIKKAFHKMAKKYHPDKNKSPGAEAKFREIAEAYETLSDDKKRREYDQYGHGPPPGAADGWGGGGGSDYNFQHHYQSFNFDDWFKDFDDFDVSHHQQQQQHRQKNRVQGAKNKHKSHRSKQGAAFGGRAFADVFEDLFSLDGGHAPGEGRRFHGSGEQQRQQCRSVTQRRGNMVSTYTVCS